MKPAPWVILLVAVVLIAGGMAVYYNGGGGCFSACPAVLLGYLSAEDVTCSLATGSCTMTLVNNSSVPLTVEGCDIAPVMSTKGSATTWSDFNGTAGGPALAGIPAASSYANGSEVAGSCKIPISDLSHAPRESFVSGGFMVKLASPWNNYPPGTGADISFEGYWS